ncbi:M20/M25/M40 family metallo-hydrolase [Micromonospora chokoriensis]|uniref:M20/M25/M40 family metallo-hydrolase n=1 Tax=Micromonospora chokoriensis TaxID=356851 RepID=UPI00068DF8DF|nr:M20/M25/M40 family metallo-hydrolase [Micromonospora chokoriensis]
MLTETVTAPPPRAAAPPPGRTSPLPALIAIGALILLTALTLLSLRPAGPEPASAPATEFSADRAMAKLDRIAARAHPTGSPTHQQVRDYLVAELRAAGLEPSVQDRVAVRATENTLDAGSVSNVYATIAGRQSTGQVLLVAHYDSVPIGPGAADNGGNVAALLEIVRVLKAGAQSRNDIGVLFTDAEEQGLLGAKAFLDSGAAGDPARVVAVNFEARGSSGPAVMFETVGGDLTPAVRASGALTTSAAVQVYRAMPNDTDLSVLGDAGMRGLNLAHLAGAGHYHTAHDSADRLSRASVQDMGEAGLGAARELAGADLADTGSEGTFFSFFGTVIWYPALLVLPLAVLTAAGFLALLWWGRRRGLSPRGVARTVVTLPLCLLAAAVLGQIGWLILAGRSPGSFLLMGGVYHPARYLIGVAALLLVALLVWYRWARRRASALDAMVGVAGWFSLLAVACAVLAPGAAYLFTWPALAGLAGAWLALRRGPADPLWTAVAGGVFAAVAVVLVLPVVMLMVPPLGLPLTVLRLLLAITLGAALLAVLGPLPPRRALTAGMLTLTVAGVAAIVIVAAGDRYSSRDPQPVSLGYLLEADAGRASWISNGGPAQPVVGPLLNGGGIVPDQRVPHLAGAQLQAGPAAVAPEVRGAQVEQPTTRVQDGVTTTQARIRVPADVYSIIVFADTSAHEILGATVNGGELPGGRNVGAASAPWGWGFGYAGPPADGVELTIRSRGTGALRILVTTTTAGLPASAPLLPADLSWANWPSVAGQTFVVSTHRL